MFFSVTEDADIISWKYGICWYHKLAFAVAAVRSAVCHSVSPAVKAQLARPVISNGEQNKNPGIKKTEMHCTEIRVSKEKSVF